MRYILLCADSPLTVWQVPNAVAENLAKYCADFDKWLHESPDAEKYRTGQGVCYTERDFIDYLNACVFPDEPSFPVENLGWITKKKQIPEGYRKCPSFSF